MSQSQESHREKISSPLRVVRYRRLLALLFIIAIALTTRGLTANLIRAHLDEPAWFPSGIYASFDRSAQNWLDGRNSIFWIDDPARTDAAIYPPGYPLWLAIIYKLSGSRSPAMVQNVQWVLDSLSVLLVVGIAMTAFGWGVGLSAGLIAAFWPLLATYGAVPLADAPTSWIVLGAVWMFLLAVNRKSFGWAFGAGALIGLSCWLRANAMLLPFFWAAAILIVVRTGWQRRILLSGTVLLASLLLIAPIVWRNAVAFHRFVPTGLGTGTNLLEGIGETERGGQEFRVPAIDAELLEQERCAAQAPPGTSFELYYPNGIERDRDRTKRALAIIKQHPFWYAGSVGRRMAGVLKYAGAPNGIYGTAGINVTSAKTLPARIQGGVIALPVNLLGMIQSVLRYVLLPLMIVGIFVALRTDWRASLSILAAIFYYLFVGSLIHTHIRYGLPMHALLTVFAAVAMLGIGEFIKSRKRASNLD